MQKIYVVGHLDQKVSSVTIEIPNDVKGKCIHRYISYLLSPKTNISRQIEGITLLPGVVLCFLITPSGGALTLPCMKFLLY